MAFMVVITFRNKKIETNYALNFIKTYLAYQSHRSKITNVVMDVPQWLVR